MSLVLIFYLHHGIYASSPSKLFLDTRRLLCVSFEVPFAFAFTSWPDLLPRNHHQPSHSIIQFFSFETDFLPIISRIYLILRIAYLRSQPTQFLSIIDRFLQQASLEASVLYDITTCLAAEIAYLTFTRGPARRKVAIVQQRLL